MAKFRMVHTEFWDDPKVVEEMTPEDKYFFLYLLTNSNTTQIGIYQITKKQIAFDMGYSIESVNALLDRFIKHHGIISYNSETRELAVKNWGRYNFNRGGKPVLDCVKSELKSVKDISLIQFVGERVEKDDIRNLYESYYVTSENIEEFNDNNGLYDTYHDTLPIGGQEEEKEEEEKEEEEKEKEEEGEGEEQKTPPNAANFYQENFGVLNAFIGETIFYWEQDLGVELVIEAMKRALKQQKKWAYAEGILKDWANKNLRTMKDILASDKEFENRNINRKSTGKAIRTEKTPSWLDDEEKPKEPSKEHSPEELQAFEDEKTKLFNRIRNYKDQRSG
ncbi:DnaD domain-containing protein [Bacillus sp. AFS040349]|uniref:DnaD domain-containing protein n=1 Tax=Bacillus sp. AFS040349 TaxID=2033502 RepID=UPI000BFC6AB0|nr:DnaD domain protein [Bacillus sp. AFS040349]PGT89197.1 replication protein [Bacillus sp. AFS040349]